MDERRKTEDGKHWRTRIGGNAAVKLASELVGRVATFGLAIVLANRLGQTDFGFYGYGLALGFVLSQLADMGLQVLMTREVAVYGRGAQGAVWLSFKLKLVLSVPVVVLLLLLTASRPGTIRLTFIILGLALLLQTYLDFAGYIWRGQQRLLDEAKILTASRLLTATIAFITLWQNGGLLAIAASYLIAIFVTTLYAYRRLYQEGWLGQQGSGIGDRGSEASHLAPDTSHLAPRTSHLTPYALLRDAIPLGFAIFLSIGYTRVAIFMLEFLLDEVAVATYSAAHRLVEPTQLLPAALMAAVFPAFSHALHHNPGRARTLAITSTLLLAGVGLAIALTFWFGSSIIIPLLYNEAYDTSIPVLQYLGLSALPASINYSLTHILIARNQQRLSSLFVALMLTIHVTLSWQLIPTLGATAPALSVTIAEFVLLACCLIALAASRQRPTAS